MHQVENYDLVVSRTEDPQSREILLLAVERKDIPETLGVANSATWVGRDDQWSLKISFRDADQAQTPVLFAPISAGAADALIQFDSILLAWLDEAGVVGEEEVAVSR